MAKFPVTSLMPEFLFVCSSASNKKVFQLRYHIIYHLQVHTQSDPQMLLLRCRLHPATIAKPHMCRSLAHMYTCILPYVLWDVNVEPSLTNQLCICITTIPILKIHIQHQTSHSSPLCTEAAWFRAGESVAGKQQSVP